MKLVLCDFDGTLTTKDSFLEFIKFTKGRAKYYVGLTLLSPVLFLYKAGLMKNWKAKEAVLSYFFKGAELQTFKANCSAFSSEIIGKILNQEVFERLIERQKNGYRIIIVSASAENWIRPWSESYGFELIGTKLAVSGNALTGTIDGRNCYGIEKVNRIKTVVDLNEFETIEVYGDSRGDKEMMEIATKKYYKGI